MTKQVFDRMIQGAASAIRDSHALLSELDSVGGDGDHGETMLRVMEHLERSFATSASPDLNSCLREAGWNVMGVNGGAASSIMGAFFLGMGDGPEDGNLAALFESGLVTVRRYTKAEPGDKTMMDALVPAVKALHDAENRGKSEAESLQCAARAARTGAESTKNMMSRYGRAKFAGDRTRGYADPGATSIALIFEGFFNANEK